MRLRIVTPGERLLDANVEKVIAEAPNGSFALLPRHIDFATALRPGVLIYQSPGGDERFIGHDAGTLVKCGDEVLVAILSAVAGDDLATLQSRVENVFLQLDEQERASRAALARLEAGLIRTFIELEAPT